MDQQALTRCAVLVVLLGALASGCFDPEIRSCTVSCTSDIGCPSGATCGAQGFCVISEQDSCLSGPDAQQSLDASLEVDAQQGADAAPSSDAAGIIYTLRVIVVGTGRVVDVVNGIDCSSDCSYPLADGTSVTLVPQTNSPWEFADWLDQPCKNGGTVCDLTMTKDHRATAEFEVD